MTGTEVPAVIRVPSTHPPPPPRFPLRPVGELVVDLTAPGGKGGELVVAQALEMGQGLGGGGGRVVGVGVDQIVVQHRAQSNVVEVVVAV